MDVQRYLAGEPVLAVPPSAGYRLRKFARKHRAALTTAAAVALLLVAGVSVSSWQAVRATNAEGDARAAAEQARLAQLAEAEAHQAEKTRADSEARAKQEAEDQTKRAEAALGEAKRRLELVFDMVADIDYRKVRAEQRPLEAEFAARLVQLAKQLEAHPPHPLDLATLQNRIGETLNHLGHPQEAVPLLLKARQTRESLLGADHPETLAIVNGLAVVYQSAGRLDLALPLFEDTLKATKVKKGADHPDTLMSMANLALAYHQAAQLDRAMPLLKETLRLRKAKLGADHPDTLTSMNNLAEGYRAARKLELALPLYEEALKLSQVKRGADHPATLTYMSNLAEAYRDANKLDLALPLYQEALRLQKLKLGAEHPQTLKGMSNLAVFYRATGQLDKALPLLEETLKLMKARLGADHPDTLAIKNNLAMAYRADGQLELALRLFLEAAAGFEQQRFQHEGARLIVINLIDCLEQMKRFDQAEVWRRKWLAVVKERSGADSGPYAVELVLLGRNLIQQRKWTDAEAVYRETLAIPVPKQFDTWGPFYVRSMLGEAMLGQQKYAEAEPLLLAGYEGMKARATMISVAHRTVLLTEALERLVRLYEATGKKEEAAKWRKELNAAKAGKDETKK